MDAATFLTLLSAVLECVYWLLVYISRKYPKTSRLRSLLHSTYGPRTDIVNMTRRDLFKSGFSFLLWAIHFAVLHLVTFFLARRLCSHPNLPAFVMAVLFFTCIFSAIAFAAALYLFFRAAFRSPNYRPPPYAF